MDNAKIVLSIFLYKKLKKERIIETNDVFSNMKKTISKIGTALLAATFIISSASIPAQAKEGWGGPHDGGWGHEDYHGDDYWHNDDWDKKDDRGPGYNDREDPCFPQPEPEPEVPEIEPEPEITTEQISLHGIYVLKQGVPADLDITQSTASSYWVPINYDVANVTVTLGEEGIITVNIENYDSASIALANTQDFLTVLNTAVTGATDDDTYTWEWQKVIYENDGYHLDCVAYVPEYSITLVSNMEGVNFSNIGVLRNDTVSFPEIPEVEGYAFENWYIDEACTEVYDVNTQVKNSFTLYAKWTEVEVPKDESVTPVEPVEPPVPQEPENPTVAPEEPKEEIETPSEEPKQEIENTEEPKEETKEEIKEESAETPVQETSSQPEQTPTPSPKTSTEPEVVTTPAPVVIIPVESTPATTIVETKAEETAPSEIEVIIEEEEVPLENLILEEELEKEIIEIDDSEIPLAKNDKGCVIHLLMYILIIANCLYFAVMGFLKDKSERKYYVTRFVSCIVVISLCVLMTIAACSLDFYIFLLGALVCLGTFMGAKHFREDVNEEVDIEK